MKNYIVYKTGFSDQVRITLMTFNTKLNFHHWLDIFFLSFLFWTNFNVSTGEV